MITSAYNYFGESFNFFKRQLVHHHPNLGIDLDSMEMDRDLLKKEEAKVEERGDKEKEENKEKEVGDKGDTIPISP